MTPAPAAVPEAVVCALLAAPVCALLCLLVPVVLARLPHAYRVEGFSRARCALVGAAAGALLGAVVGPRPELAVLVVVAAVCLLLAVVDLRHRLLPRVVVLPVTGVLLALAGLDALLTGESGALVRGIAGLLVARGLFWVLWFVHSAGLGFGDVRLAGLLGLVLGHLGWAELVVGIYAGFALLAVPGLALALVRRDRAMLRAAYPFGPFLAGGALVGVVAGPTLAGLDGG